MITTHRFRPALIAICILSGVVTASATGHQDDSRKQLIRDASSAIEAFNAESRRVSELMRSYGPPRPTSRLGTQRNQYMSLLAACQAHYDEILPWLLDALALQGDFREVQRVLQSYGHPDHIVERAHWALAQAVLGQQTVGDIEPLVTLIYEQEGGVAALPSWPRSSASADVKFNACVVLGSTSQFSSWETQEHWLLLAVKTAPEQALPYGRLAGLYVGHGMKERALECYEMAIRYSTGEARKHYVERRNKLVEGN